MPTDNYIQPFALVSGFCSKRIFYIRLDLDLSEVEQTQGWACPEGGRIPGVLGELKLEETRQLGKV